MEELYINEGTLIGSPTENSERSCRPVRNFVFLKTMKTGGSTVASILYRYGLRNGLIAAINPTGTAAILPDKSDIEPGLKILRYNCTDFPGYNFMASHVHYNRLAMDEIIPNAKYFAILRSPYEQRRSQFYYSDADMDYPNISNPFAAYLRDIEDSHILNGKLIRVMRNGTSQFHTLGFLPKYHTNKTAVNLALQLLDNELDLIMLLEYFDESLVLLRKLMCWNFEDIIYSPCKVHYENQAPITPKMKESLARLNPGDVQLYEHFNATFWEKIKNYDGDFDEDLRRFQYVQGKITTQCANTRSNKGRCRYLQSDTHLIRAVVSSTQSQWICK
ncbi:galactosylceramide sulfotransferase-like [Glandiceps talaboti]